MSSIILFIDLLKIFCFTYLKMIEKYSMSNAFSTYSISVKKVVVILLRMKNPSLIVIKKIANFFNEKIE